VTPPPRTEKSDNAPHSQPPPITSSEAPSTINTSVPQQIILPPPPLPPNGAVSFANTATTTTTDQFGMRYPIIQTISPFFSAGGTNAPQLIFSPEQQQQQYISYPEQQAITQTTDPIALPFMLDQQQQQQLINTLPSAFMAAPPQLQQTTKKKKKRLSKKQQQQQAQLQFRQQLLLQHIQQQQQQQALANAAFTIFPQSFPFMQPMPFFQQPTTILLPNLILGQDGTLFVQQQQQQPSTPIHTGGNVIRGAPAAATVQQGSQIIAPKREDVKGAEDELRRNNPTPDSSTGDLLGILGGGGGSGSSSATTTPIPSPNIGCGSSGTAATVVKKATKSRAVSSTSVKRVFHQKQILPKIDSSTHPSEWG